MTTPAATPTTTARATPEIRNLLTRPLLGFAIAVVMLFASSLLWPSAWLLGIVFALAGLTYATYVTLYLRRALIEFGGGRYRVREATSDVQFSATDAAVVVPIGELMLPRQTGPALVVIGKTRRRLVEINATSFGKAALEALVNDLLAHGVPLDHLSGQWTPRRFDQRYPGVLSWAARHPIATNVIFVTVVCVVGVAVTAVFA